MCETRSSLRNFTRDLIAIWTYKADAFATSRSPLATKPCILVERPQACALMVEKKKCVWRG